MPPDPAAIARRLSEAQRILLRQFPNFAAPRHTPEMRRDLFILWSRDLYTAEDEELTPLGLLVRAELERMEAKDE